MPPIAGSCARFRAAATIIPVLRAGKQDRLRRVRLPMYLLYRILTALGMFLIAPYYAWRGWRRGEPASTLWRALRLLASGNCRARRSHRPAAIWIHAVSVGEVLAAQPLVERLKTDFPAALYLFPPPPKRASAWRASACACADGIFYFPLDWVVPVRRALRAIRPALVIVMETEIWPNFLREAQRAARSRWSSSNARISERSFARFQRWKFLVGEFYARVLRDAGGSFSRRPRGRRAPARNGRPGRSHRSDRQS